MADFKEIKSRISFMDVLGHYNISLKASNQFTLTGQCPLPSHGSEKSKASFSVNTDKNLFNCFSDSCKKARGRSGGDVIEFVKQMESCTYQEAGNKLNEWFVQKVHIANEYEPFGHSLKGITATHPYIQGRGFAAEVCEKYGVGFFPGKGSMANRVVFPIHDEQGVLWGYAGRALEGEPRWLFPKDFPKGKFLFGLNQCDATIVAVVESFWGVLRCAQFKLPAVALMGKTASEAQKKLLMRFKRVMVMLDGDEPGRAGTDKLAAELVPFVWTRTVRLPMGKQPDDFPPEELRDYMRSQFT